MIGPTLVIQGQTNLGRLVKVSIGGLVEAKLECDGGEDGWKKVIQGPRLPHARSRLVDPS